MNAIDYDQLDPGIKEVVRLAREDGFDTTDSGDGISKPADWYASGEALPWPHLVVSVAAKDMLAEADRLQALLGDDWWIEATYFTRDQICHLLATKGDPVERYAEQQERTFKEMVLEPDEWTSADGPKPHN